MSKNITTIEKSAIEYLCGLIRELSNVSEGIDDINLKTNGTFSSVKIDTLLNNLETNCNEYTDRLVANLSRLELKIVTNEADINKPNILYLHKPVGATSYNQYVVIEGNKVLLGTTDISMTDYYTITQADAKFALKTTTDTLTTEVTNIKSDFNTHKDDTDIHIASAERTKWDKTSTDFTTHSSDTDIHTSADEKASYIKKTDIVTTINSSSTDDTVPSVKSVYNAINTLNNDVYHAKRTLLFESGANGESDGSIIIGKEYTAKESILPHRMATVITSWRECAFTKANWYNENWFYIDGHANDYNEEQNILFTYEIRILVKQSDTKIFKVLYSKRLAFNLNDNTFTSTDIKSGIALSKFV